MVRLIIAVAIGAVVAGVAYVVQRRRPAPPTQAAWHPPMQIDRADFEGNDKPWLVAVFTSHSCSSCEKAIAAASFLESKDVEYQLIPVEDQPALHDRYQIEQIPLILIADDEGVVQGQYVGPPVAAEVWAEFAQIRSHSD